MVFGILGSYLEKKGLVTDVQLRNVLAEQQKVRVKLGLIAVAEGFMTKEQADRVNLLQSQVDMKFGDIAVKEGYLTFGQVDTLIRKQGNPYLAFAQALDNLGFMSYEKLEAYVEEFKKEYSLTDSDIDDIKRDDMDRIIPIFLPNDSSEYANLAGIAFRTIMRCVDFELFPEKAYFANELKADDFTYQLTEGKNNYYFGIAGEKEALLPIAQILAKEDFDVVDMDALDAVGELCNWINGLFATDVSTDRDPLELYPPEFFVGCKRIKADKMLVFPVHVQGEIANLLISINNKFEVE